MSQHTWDLRDVRARVRYYGMKGSWHVYHAYPISENVYLGQVASFRSGRGWMARTPDRELLSAMAFRSRKTAAISLRNHYEQKSNP